VSDPHIDLVLDGHIARLTIRRPEKLNALDAKMIEALFLKCREVEASAARVLIVTGEGEKSFCAGGDIAAWSGLSAHEFGRYWVRYGHTAFDSLARLSVPVIAVLNGHCLGGGLELAACADVRIAEAHVKVGLPETGLGIVPGWSGSQRAVRRFGSQVVRRMALFGEIYGVREALELGIVDIVAEKGMGMETAEALAAQAAERSPLANEVTKMMINAAEGEESERVLEAITGMIAAGSAELQEGVMAFREKRKPKF
jgi:enoyl-CoA hydratase